MNLTDYFRQQIATQPTAQTAPVMPAPLYPQAPATSLSPQEQLIAALDPNSSGDAWNVMGRDWMLNDIGNSLQSTYGTNDLSSFNWINGGMDANGNPIDRMTWDGMPTYANTGSISQAASSMMPGTGQFGRTYNGEGGTQYELYKKPDGSTGVRTYGRSTSDQGDIISALAVLGGGLAASGVLGAAAGGGAGAGAEAAGAAGTGAAGAAGADLGMAGFGQIGIPSAIPAGAGYGITGTAGLPAVSTFGGSAIGGGLAGALSGAGTASAMGGAGGGTGATDLGGGLSMGADGSISGATAASPSSLSNAGIMDSVGAGGAGFGGVGSGGSTASSGLSKLMSNPLGLASTVLGALGGSKGQSGSSSSTQQLPAYLQGPVANDLIPRTQGLLGPQMPTAQTAGNQLLTVGSGLLGQTAPNTATNPYATGILDDMQRRQQELIARSLQQTKGNAVGYGGLGGSRQGIAEADAIARGAENFAGQGLNFMGGLYQGDQSRLLQQQTLGAGLMAQGLDMPFSPLKNAASIYSPFSGYGTTTNTTQQGGGTMGAIGGALGAAQLAKNLFGSGSGSSTSGGWW